MFDRIRGASRRLRGRLRRRRNRVKRWLIRARFDFREWRSGNRDPLVPPRRKGLPSQIAAVGERLAGEIRQKGDLQSDWDVLDVGCGSGRVAAPLTRVIDPVAGSYEGFDIMPASIKWCRRAITKRHPNFHFQLADLYNAQYNPEGTQRASEFRFPFADDSFDLAWAASLFTHLRPFEGRHYLDEVARVLRPGGRFISTWFLINEEAEEMLARGLAKPRGASVGTRPPVRLTYSFTDEQGFEFRSPVEATPEHLIAIDEDLVRTQHAEAGLEIVEIAYGTWPGREGRAGQDMIVARLGEG